MKSQLLTSLPVTQAERAPATHCNATETRRHSSARAGIGESSAIEGASYEVGPPPAVTVFLQVAPACNLDCYTRSKHLQPVETRRERNATSLSPELLARLKSELLD
ncbi:MAG TPA: hypothetical protein QF764_02415 [Planctomycetota bacterium]|nr:hypothetical protein [Planctomycetota bacterium]